ncbi:MAG: hypothetical protein HRF40_08220 [Nitrososphaera sp.]|jgi:hypothetical protein
MAHKGKVLSRIDVILVGAGMVIAFSLILIRLLGLVESPTASSSEIVASFLQRLCVTMPFDLMTLCK